jgi:anthranilate synthase component 1
VENLWGDLHGFFICANISKGRDKKSRPFLCKENEMYQPSFVEFEKLARKGNLIAVCREILADVETPVSVLMKLQHKKYVYLLESVEGGEKWGRYSFLGVDAGIIFRVRSREVIIEEGTKITSREHNGQPLKVLRGLMNSYRPVTVPGLPRFFGGAVGFLGYEMVRYFEKLPQSAPDDLQIDDAFFVISDTIMIFDNIRHTIKIVSCAYTEGIGSLEEIYKESCRKIDTMIETLSLPSPHEINSGAEDKEISFTSNMTPAEYKSVIGKAKEYITAGDIIQVVLSQRFETDCHCHPIDLYRALRYVNPSPYLFYLKLNDLTLIGSKGIRWSSGRLPAPEEGVKRSRKIALYPMNCFPTRRKGRNTSCWWIWAETIWDAWPKPEACR